MKERSKEIHSENWLKQQYILKAMQLFINIYSRLLKVKTQRRAEKKNINLLQAYYYFNYQKVS